MNIDKLKERSSQSINFKDIRNKEVYPGDIIVISKSNASLTPVMILDLNPKSIKCITLNKNTFNYFGEFIKITDFYDKEEINQWDNIKSEFLLDKAKKKAEHIKKAIVIIFFKDNKLNKCGICYSLVHSDPGKNINLNNIKKALEWLNDYPEKEFFFFTKDMRFDKAINRNIFLGTDNTFYNVYMTPYNSVFSKNTFYYMHKSNCKSIHDINRIKFLEQPSVSYSDRIKRFKYQEFQSNLFKYFVSEDIEITEDSVYYFPIYRFLEKKWNNYDNSVICGKILFQKFEEYF